MQQDFQQDITITSKGQLTLPVKIRRVHQTRYKTQGADCRQQGGHCHIAAAARCHVVLRRLEKPDPVRRERKAVRAASPRSSCFAGFLKHAKRPHLSGRRQYSAALLRNDHPQLSPRAAKLIEQANAGKAVLHISAVTVAEVFYALKTSYKVSRRQAAAALMNVLSTPAFRMSPPRTILDGLARVLAANVDFGDGYIAAAAVEAGIPVASFDRDLDKFDDLKRFEP